MSPPAAGLDEAGRRPAESHRRASPEAQRLADVGVPGAVVTSFPESLVRTLAQLPASTLEAVRDVDPRVFRHWDRLDLAALHRDGFTAQAIAETWLWQDALMKGVPDEAPVLAGELERFTREDFAPMPAAGCRERAALESAGREARAQGKVAMFVLAGGRASRMKNHVKGVVEVVGGGWTFLDIKLKQARDAGVPLVVGSSPATDQELKAHLLMRLEEEQGPDVAETERARLAKQQGPLTRVGDVLVVRQGLRPAVDAETGELVLFSNGQPYLYPPGHGSFLEVFHTSGLLEELRERGVEHLFLGNVDNLGQDVDDALLGRHVSSEGMAVTVEAARRIDETGGVLGTVAGAPVALESIPDGKRAEDFDFLSITTLYMRLDALAGGGPVRPQERVVVKKPIDPVTNEVRTVKQKERVTGEMTWLVDARGRQALPTQVVEVPRREDGGKWRFAPIKDWEALKEAWPDVAERVGLDPVPPTLPAGV